MAQFKVGDRVRIRKDIKAPGYEWALGVETKIVGIAPFYPFTPLEWVLELIAPNGFPLEAHSAALEPLVPPAVDEWAKNKVLQVTKIVQEPVKEKETV